MLMARKLRGSLDELNFFSQISGLKINTSETQVVWVGNRNYSNEVIFLEANFGVGATYFNYFLE